MASSAGLAEPISKWYADIYIAENPSGLVTIHSANFQWTQSEIIGEGERITRKKIWRIIKWTLVDEITEKGICFCG